MDEVSAPDSVKIAMMHAPLSAISAAHACMRCGAGALSSQLAALESSLHAATLELQTLIDQLTGPDHNHMLTMFAVRMQQPEVRMHVLHDEPSGPLSSA